MEGGSTGTRTYKALSGEQVQQFRDKGWVRIERAFPPEVAEECQQFLWERIAESDGVLQGDRSTWTKPIIYHQISYRGESFDQCNTERLASAIEDLVGPGRWRERVLYDGTDQAYPTWGWWPVNFSLGGERDWEVPTEGWHWDGQHFRHYVDSPDQGLLCLCLFSDIGPRGGGTLIVEGSHRIVARYLAGQPDGVGLGEGIGELNRQHPYLAELTGRVEPTGDEAALTRNERFMGRSVKDADGTELRVVETTGKPGDVILCHPFLYHAASQNHSGAVRFMCNRTTPLSGRLDLQRADRSQESPLEQSIREALEGELEVQ